MTPDQPAAVIETAPLALGPDLADALPRLARALTGRAPIRPVARTSANSSLSPADRMHPASATATSVSRGSYPRVGNSGHVPADLAVVVGTSGSTGTPKLAMLTARALAASIGATHRHLGGPGQWVLALPPHHIAGLQVLLRGIVAGTPTVALPGPFTLDSFVAATALLDPDLRHYTSLVPTQVARLLDPQACPEGAEALRAFAAILVGGAALPPRLRELADAEGIVLVATYGMSETGGGCVYDGIPLGPTRVRLTDEGRILLGGDTLASGYLGDIERTAAAFVTDTDSNAEGATWFRTDDHGQFLPDGRLHVDGRLDDLINTGGLKVAPRVVEEALLAHLPEVSEACVVGLPDDEWGQCVAALLVVSDTTDPTPHLTASDVRARLRGILPDHALPQRVATTDALFLCGLGKPDRRAIADLLQRG